jgi:hypothetical protein
MNWLNRILCIVVIVTNSFSEIIVPIFVQIDGIQDRMKMFNLLFKLKMEQVLQQNSVAVCCSAFTYPIFTIRLFHTSY